MRSIELLDNFNIRNLENYLLLLKSRWSPSKLCIAIITELLFYRENVFSSIFKFEILFNVLYYTIFIKWYTTYTLLIFFKISKINFYFLTSYSLELLWKSWVNSRTRENNGIKVCINNPISSANDSFQAAEREINDDKSNHVIE